jgi:hypothetical protein
MQTGLGVIISATSVTSIKANPTNTDMVLNLYLPLVPEIDPHRTAPTGLPGLPVVMLRQTHGLSMGELR